MGKFVEGFSRNEIAVGTTFGIRHGSTVDLPDVGPGKHWVQFDHNEMGRMYVVEEVAVTPNLREENDKLQEVIRYKDGLIEGMEFRIRDVEQAINRRDERIKDGTEQNAKLQNSADEWRTKYHEQSAEIKRLNGVNDSQAGRIRYLEDESKELRYLLEPKNEDKECAVAEQSVEAKAYEDIHTKRMAAEIRSIELDNLKKENELKFGEESPRSIWHNLQTRIKDNENATKTITLWGSFTGIAILINEVAQWVNL